MPTGRSRRASGTTLEHLGRTTLHIPYPWVAGEAHLVKVLTSTGTTFEHEIAVAVETPQADARHLGAFALIGLYVGVMPVALGLLLVPGARAARPHGPGRAARASPSACSRSCSSTPRTKGSKARRRSPASFQGMALFVGAAAARTSALEAFGAVAARAARARRKAARAPGSVLALLIAIGIGLHNFGEGLAIGAAFALGEAALGTLLIVGFTLHNTTEGLAILAPIAKERPSVAAADQARADRRRADDRRRVARRVRLLAAWSPCSASASARARSRRSSISCRQQIAGSRSDRASGSRPRRSCSGWSPASR